MIYLDHHATTPVDPRVLEAMLPYFTVDFGNASSHTHRFGWRADAALEVAREMVAEGLGAAEPREVVFTSGATESDNLAIQGVFNAAGGGHIVTVATEHAAVLDTCAALARRGARVTYVPVDSEGAVDPAEVAAAITDETVLVSVMAANSEIGTIAPLAEIGACTAARDVLFHCDAAQAVGKIPLDVEALGIDLLSVSAHKLYGPKGVGALYVRRRRRATGKRIRVEPLVYGGGHERGLRSGTLPIPLVVGLGRAVSLAVAGVEEESVRVGALRDQLWSELEKHVGEVALNGPHLGAGRLAGNLNVSFAAVAADALISQLPDLALSTGSACASASPELSHVLRACGHDDDRIRGSLRVGLGRDTTELEIQTAARRIGEEVAHLRAAAPQPVAPGGAGR